MRLPTIKIHEPTKEVTYNLGELETPDYSLDLSNRDKVIKRIEKIVRSSIEYKELISFLKEEMDFSHCIFLTNVDYDIAALNFHHDPLRLYDVCDIILNKHEKLYEDVSIFKVAEEVMLVHYKGMIPLIPITFTIHQLVHSDSLFIPIQLINQSAFGDYKLFCREYKNYMSDDYKRAIKEYISLSNEVIEDYQVPILDRKFTYIHCDDFVLPKRIEREDD